MSIFAQVKDAVDIVGAARRYGLEVNRRGKAHCCFHSPDRHPSLSFKGRVYTCFSCGAHGDVLDLVAHLTGAGGPLGAAQELDRAYGLELDAGKPSRAEARRYAQERERLEAFAAWEKKACGAIADYCRFQEQLKAACAPETQDDEIHPLYAEACADLEYASYIYDAVFIKGDFQTKARFYEMHAEEVKQIEQEIRKNIRAG